MKQISDLSEQDIKEIIYLSRQSNGRRRLITNIFNISDEVLNQILLSFAN
jgi:hypothetical protein